MNRQVAWYLHLRGKIGICTEGDGMLSEVHFGFLVARGQKRKERAGRRRAVGRPCEWSGDGGLGVWTCQVAGEVEKTGNWMCYSNVELDYLVDFEGGERGQSTGRAVKSAVEKNWGGGVYSFKNFR